MKRQLLMFAVLVGICAFNIADRQPSATASSYPMTPVRSEACMPSATPAAPAMSGSMDSSPALTWPLCGAAYCHDHQQNVCTCPAGTVRAGQPAPCDTWYPDCRAL